MPALSSPARRFLPPLLAFALVALLGWLLLRPAPQAPAAASSLLGQPAPDFALRTLSGEELRLSALRGQPIILNFWASWCGPCQEEAPLLSELSTRQAAQGFKIVGVLFQETSPERARQFVAAHRLRYPNTQDEGAEAAIAYGLTGIPDTFFIDRDGKVRAALRGGLNRERLNTGLASLGLPEL